MNRSDLQELLEELSQLRSEMLELEASGLAGYEQAHQGHAASARNLMHYLALRKHDIRELQSQLAGLGLSSLGRTEPHVLQALQTVIGLLERLVQSQSAESASAKNSGVRNGNNPLTRNTEALLGPAPQGRTVRIMVTMPSEAASDYMLVRDLVAHGMDCMRINCAHDGPSAWEAMIRNLRRAEVETNRPCKVLMDLPGPKLRTGPIEPGPRVLKCRPKRDVSGRVDAPARIWLTPEDAPAFSSERGSAIIRVPREFLHRLKSQDRIRFRDARGAVRSMLVVAVETTGAWAEARQTAYVFQGMPIEVSATGSRAEDLAPPMRACVGTIPATEQTLHLKLGDQLILTKCLAPGRPAQKADQSRGVQPAQIGVTLSEFFESVKPGQPVWLDDGKIGAVIREVSPEKVVVEITRARPAGEKLGAEKGINLPESDLKLSALTSEDLAVLPFAVEHADIIGYSFVRRESDVRELQSRLSELGGERLGIILKIETREGFENLPRLLLTAMKSPAVGVMIARGDLAVECGYQRLAEIQEEILWICEAAHVPVIWATQVLESLAKTGIPSRSEITDAAMGERAECVMLNKGPFVVNAVKTLDDILHRMQSHQEKKRSMLRKLHVADAFHAGT